MFISGRAEVVPFASGVFLRRLMGELGNSEFAQIFTGRKCLCTNTARSIWTVHRWLKKRHPRKALVCANDVSINFWTQTPTFQPMNTTFKRERQTKSHTYNLRIKPIMKKFLQGLRGSLREFPNKSKMENGDHMNFVKY